jgi:peptidoglycan/xylan/chitin deacetylase (PgdA/CDA1 family)
MMTRTTLWLRALLGVCVAAGGVEAPAATYYVDATGGSDASNGLSAAAAWKTVAKVNGATLVAGDAVLFKRGEVWRENLVVPSSGAAGNPIRFDTYGDGPAPLLTEYLDLPASSWSVDAGNVWKAAAASSGMNWVLFGTVWGTKQTAKVNLATDRDWFFAAETLYVYAPQNPATYYAPVAAMVHPGQAMIFINGKSYVDVQHFKLSYFDAYGVRVGGASDHINVANVWAEGIVPNGVLPHGFYALSTAAPAAINFYNDDSHRNYNGFRFDSTTGIALTNSRGFANRLYGLVDSTGNTVYSYCHFYGNGIGIMPSTDVTGGTDGGQNVAAYRWPGAVNFQRYPARMTFTVDDVGLKPLAETYIGTLTPVFEQRGLRMAMGVVTGYSAPLVSVIQAWADAGHDVNSHSWSHQYYTNPTAFALQYVGTGTAAALTISGNRLTTAVTGGPGGENLNVDLTNPAYDEVHKLVMFLNAQAGYSAVQDVNCLDHPHTTGLADVAGQDILAAAYGVQLQKSRFIPDEMATSKAWLEANIVGLGTARTYVYPTGLEDTETQGWAVAAGYEGARGALSMGLGVNETYAVGTNLQNTTSFGTTSLHGLTAQQIRDRMASLVFKSAAWGVPYGLFAHKDEITPAEVGAMVDGLLQRGAVVMTNTQLADLIHGLSRVGTTTMYAAGAPGREPSVRVTGATPDAGAGTNLGATFAVDLEGRDRNVYGWDIGSVVVNAATKVSGAGLGRGAGVQ